MDPTGKEPRVKVQMKTPSNYSQPLLLWFRSTRNRRWKRNLMVWLWFVGNEICTSWKKSQKKKKERALNQSLTSAIKSQSWLLEVQQAITWGCGKGQCSVHSFAIHFQSYSLGTFQEYYHFNKWLIRDKFKKVNTFWKVNP